MKNRTRDIYTDFLCRHPNLEEVGDNIFLSVKSIVQCYHAGGKVVVSGNGGSASDSEHIVGELMKGFRLKRPVDHMLRNQLKASFSDIGDYLADNMQTPIPAISLVSQTALITALCNDIEPDMVFAQQVYGYCGKKDVLLALSTSGKSKNVIYAAMVAKVLGTKVVALTGNNGGQLAEIADITISVPATQTSVVQEFHLPVYHALCAMAESELFDI